MKIKALLFCVIILLFQSCYTYKTTTINTVETNKNYVVELNRGGRDIEGKFVSRNENVLKFSANNTFIEVPTDEIKSIRRKKLSTLMIVGSVAAVVTGTIILISNSSDNKGEIDAIPTPNN